MKKSILVRKNKGRGRPKREDGVDPMISTRFPRQIVEEMELWARKNELGRSEAIRRLVEIGLKVKPVAKPVGKPGRRLRAQELATETLVSLTVGAADTDEQAGRRRRLTKGPAEFREDRVDLPKAKGR
jgi:hypothetical protein